METTMTIIGIMEKKRETTITIIGIMEKKMETTIMGNIMVLSSLSIVVLERAG